MCNVCIFHLRCDLRRANLIISDIHMLDVGDFRIYVTSISHCVVKYFTVVVVDVVFAENALFGTIALKHSHFRQYLCSHINIIINVWKKKHSIYFVSKVRKLLWLDWMPFSQNDYEYSDLSFHSCIQYQKQTKSNMNNRAISSHNL